MPPGSVWGSESYSFVFDQNSQDTIRDREDELGLTCLCAADHIGQSLLHNTVRRILNAGIEAAVSPTMLEVHT